MIRIARASWSLLLLLVLGQQSWEAEAEVSTLAHSVGHSMAYTGVHSVAHTRVHDLVRGEKLIRHSSIGGKLKKIDTAEEDLRAVKTEKLDLSLNFAGAEGKPTSNSSRANFSCPDSTAIAPCVCTVNADNNIDLDCTFVESEEQLEAVFNQEFPIKELHGFYMANNSAIKVLTNSHSGVSFERIDLYPGPFVLQSISDYFLLDSRLTLSYLRIEESQLLSAGFPFAILDEMAALDSLTISYSVFTWIPKINSPTIRELRFTYGSVDDIDPGTFDDVTNLNFLGLTYNSLTELRAGTVPIREGPMSFMGYYNNIQVVHPGAFFLRDASSTGSSDRLYIGLDSNLLQSLQAGTIPLRNSPVTIYLHFNQIASIEPGTFVLPEATDSFSLVLYLFNNQLTTFDEAVFGDLMPFFMDARLHDNPFSCGCDIAWLIESSAFMNTVDSYATCANGTNLHDLDPQGYLEVC